MADSGIFMDRMNSSTQAENRDAILANPNYTLYVPDAAAREVNVTHPVYGPAQAQRLTRTPDGAGIIRLPDPSLDGIDPRALIQTRGFGSNDMLIVETARARGLPVLTTNQALATQVKDSNYPFRVAQWGQVPIIVIPS